MKRRKQNHKISYQFFAAPPCTPAVLKGKERKFLVLVRDWKECEARIVSITTKSERTTWFKATTRSARAKLIKIRRILFVKSSNFVQETPPREIRSLSAVFAWPREADENPPTRLEFIFSKKSPTRVCESASAS